MIGIWMENHLVGDNIRNIVSLQSPQKNCMEWHIMLGQNLVLATLHHKFPISIEKDN